MVILIKSKYIQYKIIIIIINKITHAISEFSKTKSNVLFIKVPEGRIC